jgi:thioredoxin 1
MQEVVSATFNADVLAASKERPVVVDFWAPWCGPCVRMAPVLETIAAENTNTTFVKLNVDVSPDIAQRYGISGVPTLIIFSNGAPARFLTSATSRRAILKGLEGYL